MKAIIEIERRIAAQEKYAREVLGKNIERGYSLNLDEQKAMAKACGLVTNKMRSKVELYHFAQDKPESYLAYMKGNLITNFMGETLGRVTSITSRHNISGHLSNEKIYFRATGTNGVKYRGIGYGVYCRLYAIKEKVDSRLFWEIREGDGNMGTSYKATIRAHDLDNAINIVRRRGYIDLKPYYRKQLLESGDDQSYSLFLEEREETGYSPYVLDIIQTDAETAAYNLQRYGV